MKKLVVLLTLIATASAFSQGQVNFNNKVSSSAIDAPISYLDGPVAGTRPNATVNVNGFGGINAMAGLYGGAAGTAEGSLVLLTPALPFRSTAATAGYIDSTYPNNTGNSIRILDGVAPQTAAVFQVRAWDTGLSRAASYEEALLAPAYYSGKSVLINIASIGGGSVGPSQLVGLQPFAMSYVPEPSIIGLGLLGAVAGMVVFRRRQ